MMNNPRDGGGGTSPGSEYDSEGDDVLAPLPDDLLIHACDMHNENKIQSQSLPIHDGSSRIPLGHEDVPFSSYPPAEPEHSQQDAPTIAASRRRSLQPDSGRPIFPVRNPTKQDLVHARKLLETLQKEHGFTIPDRGNLDDPCIMWKEGKPDYTIADLHFLLGKTKNHPSGSLEQYVENFIKTWEMEATHKEFYQWTTVDQYDYEVQANGGRAFSAEEAPWVGNYNWLLSTCDKTLYDSTKETFESSHGKFRYAFPEGFPFEVLEVFSGPPKISFSWRHWAVFSGEYEGNKGDGETINMTGFGVVSLNEDKKAKKIEIYYDPDGFMNVLRGKDESRDGVDRGMAFGQPIAGGLDSLGCMMAEIELEEEDEEETEKGGSSSRCPFSGMTS